MGLLSKAAIIGGGVYAIRTLDKHGQRKREAEGQHLELRPATKDQDVNQGLYFVPPQHPQGYYQRRPSAPETYPADAYSGHQRGIESGAYAHQSYCNGTCGSRCNGVPEPLPRYEASGAIKRDVKDI